MLSFFRGFLYVVTVGQARTSVAIEPCMKNQFVFAIRRHGQVRQGREEQGV